MVAYNFAKTPVPKVLPKTSSGGAFGASVKNKKSKTFVPTVAAAPPKQRGIPERVDLNKAVSSTGINLMPKEGENEDIWKTGADFIGSILTGAVKIAETPFSIANQATKGMFAPGKGIIDSTADFIGSTPVGDLARGAEFVLNAGFNIVGAAANQNFASILKDTAGMSDSTPINLPGLAGSGGISTFLAPLGLSAFGGFMAGEQDIKTVGDLRKVAAARGFTDEDVQGLVSGTKEAWDFGDKKISTNPVVDMGLRAVYDPSNLIFMGGPSLIKAGSRAAAEGLKMTGAGTDLVKGLVKAGKYTYNAIDSTAAANAIAKGHYAEASWAGVGEYLKGATKIAAVKYAKGATALTAGVVGADVVSGLAADTFGRTSLIGGMFSDIQQASSDIINDRPLSESSVFALMSASYFPLHTLMHDAKGTGVVTKTKMLGGDGASYALLKHIVPDEKKALPLREQLAWANENMRGGMAAVVNIIDRKIAYENLLRDGFHKNKFSNLPLAAEQLQEISRAVDRRVETMRKNGQITNAMREQKWIDWTMDPRGITGDALTERRSGMRMKYDRERAIATWNVGSAAGDGIRPLFEGLGNVTWGLDARITTEGIDLMKMTVKDYADANGVITAEGMRRFITDHPELGEYIDKSKNGQWWLRFTPGDKAPSTNVRALRSRLDGLKGYVTNADDVFKQATGIERAAPPPPRDFRPLATRVRDNDSLALGNEMAYRMEQIDQAAVAAATPSRPSARTPMNAISPARSNSTGTRASSMKSSRGRSRRMTSPGLLRTSSS